ncbi:MAG: twin-arginine translocase subunit TatC [Desulfococcaceae bacterium]|jgi:sec-independent protein translocase protein TatC|nr:twin-arginine translocase subunit TatC [Desulfococcaceae bacterium]
MPTEEEKMPFLSHLEELRDRLIRCMLAIGAGFCIAYAFKEKLFEILLHPLLQVMGKGETLIFTGLPEAFFTYLKVALLAGAMLASPVILYQFWMFVAPGLYQKEKKVLLPIVFLSTLFFVGGSLFGYFYVFPFGFQFFLGFANENLQALPSMKEYLTFSSKLLLAFGVVFELPLVLTAMARMGLVTPEFLRINRKYAILIFFIGAAIITPPDVVTQIMMGIPLMILYELSIWGAVVFGRKPLTADEEQEKKKDTTGEKSAADSGEAEKAEKHPEAEKEAAGQESHTSHE